MNLTSKSEIRDLLSRHNLKLKKGLGQNFLIDSDTVEKIADAAELNGDELVIEIGPGIGTLTRELAKRAGEVKTIEIDKKLIPVLEETLGDMDNVEIIEGDILKIDLDELLGEAVEAGKPIKVAANLPYYITTPIIMKFLESDLPIEQLSFLVQKEVADRIVSEPGSKAYGALSVISQYYADTSCPFYVPASVFMPRPKVDSALLILKPISGTLEDDKKEQFFKITKAAFGNRRKTLLNSLSSNLGIKKSKLRDKLESIEIDPSIRAEQLSEGDFMKISEVLESEFS